MRRLEPRLPRIIERGLYLLDVERLDVTSVSAPCISIPPSSRMPPPGPPRVVIFLRRFRDHDFRREQVRMGP